MKKIGISIFIIVIVVIICLLVKILFFSKNVPTGDQNGDFLTNYSSKDMLGNWNINITKKSDNLTINSTGIMNISSIEGRYFRGTITINEAEINNKTINGGIVNVDGNVYNDIVTIYCDYNEEYLNINLDAKFMPKIFDNYMILDFNDIVKEENKTYEYVFRLTKMEVYNNEK